MWLVLEVEDSEKVFAVADDDGVTMFFDTEAAAQNYADRHCLDGRAVEIEE